MSRTSAGIDARPRQGIIERVKTLPREAQRRLEHARARFGFVDVAVRTFKRYSEDDAGSYAAALTYYTFFALFPLLLFAAAGIGYLTFGNDELAQDLIANGVNGIPLIRDALDQDLLQSLQANKDAIAGIGLVLALYAGTGMIVALEHALNKINRVADEGNWWHKRATALKWLVVLGLIVAASLALTSVAEALNNVVGAAVSYAGAFPVDLVLFATAFKFLPEIKQSWKQVLPGAIAAAVAFGLLKGFGAAYLARGSATRSETYGALAGAATLLVASYLLCQVTLLAAEINATLIERRATRTKAAERTEEGA